MSYKRIGNYIHLVDNRNKDLAITNLLGINITKNFMPSVANTSETDLSKYKIIQKGQFAYSAMQVGRDETIRLALFTEEKLAIISPAYLVIEVNDENELLPEYMMMWFQRPESDRYGWFISDSSVRASLEWERFSEIRIPIPDIEEQRKFVALYSGLLTNQKTYENSLADLQLICDTYIENLIKTEEPKVLGEYIEQSDERNRDLKIDNLVGISVNKIFIETKSNKEQLELSNYKIVRQREFSYVSVTSRNGEKISIALLDGEAGLVSSTYTVFRVKNASILLPEYLFLFFKRTEFDRYARFNSWGSARETFDWADMCNVKLPIPDIKIQEAIVTIYHTLETRKRINEQLKNAIKPLCPVLMKGVVESLKLEKVNTQ
ncbi:restriction endonuclease subunit S [Aquiflexum sp. TKW24L]|uniref:restriction endonuclease subunit S n=1 Tax=Aquiflexum sp. TKW24L TaxID=2942212 RepID=UPI0020BEC41A|nr:restriction endonuclease subunit S [Aquiflexum sp. TKW24L]MCL6261344.1 restriction endonuclease subunit S [Aquiflexum sp. TKW24L]